MRKKIRNILKYLWNLKPIFLIRGTVFDWYEKISGYAVQRRAFVEKLEYELNLHNPKSFSEKIVWKKIYDRNPLLPVTSDKYAVREYIMEVLGAEAKDILVPLLWSGEDPRNIPFKKLPSEYVIKANHDSGGNIIVSADKEWLAAKHIRKQVSEWLRLPYGLFKHEWAYKKIKPRIIIESLLRGEDGDLAQDYKFHVFHGQCRFIHTTPKVGGVRSGQRSLFTPEWRQIDVAWKHPKGPYVSPPKKLKDMIKLAEKLAAPFDYVRVDFYNPGDKIYFGELTHYHGSGMERFTPQDFDFEAGQYWSIISRYWEKDDYATKFIHRKT